MGGDMWKVLMLPWLLGFQALSPMIATHIIPVIVRAHLHFYLLCFPLSSSLPLDTRATASVVFSGFQFPSFTLELPPLPTTSI